MKLYESTEFSYEAVISTIVHERLGFCREFEHFRDKAFELQDEDKICCHNFATLVPGLQNLAQDNLENANPILRHMLDSIPMETDVSARFMDLVSEIIL